MALLLWFLSQRNWLFFTNQTPIGQDFQSDILIEDSITLNIPFFRLFRVILTIKICTAVVTNLWLDELMYCSFPTERDDSIIIQNIRRVS